MAATGNHKKSSYEEGSLDQYRRDISAYPLISRDEEVRLAQRIRQADQEALDKLVRSNLRRAAYFALYRLRGIRFHSLDEAGISREEAETHLSQEISKVKRSKVEKKRKNLCFPNLERREGLENRTCHVEPQPLASKSIIIIISPPRGIPGGTSAP